MRIDLWDTEIAYKLGIGCNRQFYHRFLRTAQFNFYHSPDRPILYLSFSDGCSIYESEKGVMGGGGVVLCTHKKNIYLRTKYQLFFHFLAVEGTVPRDWHYSSSWKDSVTRLSLFWKRKGQCHKIATILEAKRTVSRDCHHFRSWKDSITRLPLFLKLKGQTVSRDCQ
jgi:hypothetical protein